MTFTPLNGPRLPIKLFSLQANSINTGMDLVVDSAGIVWELAVVVEEDVFDEEGVNVPVFLALKNAAALSLLKRSFSAFSSCFLTSAENCFEASATGGGEKEVISTTGGPAAVDGSGASISGSSSSGKSS